MRYEGKLEGWPFDDGLSFPAKRPTILNALTKMKETFPQHRGHTFLSYSVKLNITSRYLYKRRGNYYVPNMSNIMSQNMRFRIF